MLAGIEILPQLLAGDCNIDPRPTASADKRVAEYLFLSEPLGHSHVTHPN